MFQSLWNKTNTLVFLLLLASLAAAYLASLSNLKAIQIPAGAFALLFPVGWLLLAAIFPKKEELSLLARLLLSVFLSIAVNNLSLLAAFYLLHAPLNLQANIIVLVFFGTVFFAASVAMAER